MAAPQDDNTTLRRLLSQRKPQISCEMTNGRNSSSEKWPEVAGCITVWDEFNIENLGESYGHVLDSAVPAALPDASQILSGITIKKSEDIYHLIAWNDRMLQLTLEAAKSLVGAHPGTSLRRTFSTADRSFIARLSGPEASTRLLVDHLIELDDFPTQSLVVGLGRTSVKWSGRGLLTNPNKREFSWPVRQLANLCRIAKTRYRYIQTNEELVACCFTKSLGGGDNDWQAAIKPIPWSKHGEDVLTTDLALWWLCMLAMSPQSRAVVDKSEMIDINAWEVVEYPDERGWVRRHHYSNVEQPTEPPPPGNPAAFDAGAGINQELLGYFNAADDPNAEALNADDFFLLLNADAFNANNVQPDFQGGL